MAVRRGGRSPELRSQPLAGEVSQLRTNLATTQQLIAQAQGLAFQVQSMDQQFARLYPEQYAATVSGNQMSAYVAGVMKDTSLTTPHT